MGEHSGECGAEGRYARIEQDGHCGDNRFLGGEAGDKRSCDAPIGEAEGLEYRRDKSAYSGEHTVCAVLNGVYARVEALKEPYDNRCDKYDCKRALEEVLCLFPQQERDALGRRDSVVRQLHNERHGVAAEGGIFEYQREQDAEHYAREIQAYHDERAVSREKRRREDRIYRYFCRTAHIRGQHYRHLAVAVGRDCAGRHYRRDGASEADKHGNEAAPGETDFSQRSVHNKGDSRHISRIFENGQEEEQCHYYRQERENAANAREDSVDDKAMYNGVDSIGGQPRIDESGEFIYSEAQPIGERGADNIESQPKYEAHNADEHRNGGIFAGQDAVELHAAAVLLALAAFDDRALDYFFYEFVAHFGERGVSVEPGIVLHLDYAVVKQIALVAVEFELVRHIVAALNELCCAEAARQTEA